MKDREPKTLRDFRDLYAWSQKDVAELLGTSQPHISEWETGARTPSFPSLNKLALLYGVGIDVIVRAAVNR